MPSLGRNAVLNSIRTIMTIVYPLITYPYVTRLFEAENLGKVNFASSTISYFSLLAVLGITSYAGREGIQYRDDQKKLDQFSSELFSLSIITAAGSLILLLLSSIVVQKFHDYRGLLAIYASTIVFGPIGLSWLYSLEEDYTYITIQSIVIQGVSVVLLFVMVRKPEDYYVYAALNAFSNVGSNICNLFYSSKYIHLRLSFDFKRVFSHLKYCLVFFSSSIASSIYSNIDITMLGFFSTDYRIGIYSAAVKIYTMTKTVLNAVVTVMVPRLTYCVSQGKDTEYNALVSKLFKIMLTGLFPTVVGLILVSKELTVVILGEGFAESQASLCVLSLAIFVSMFATVINGCILIPNKKEKKVLITTASAAAVNFLTNLVAIPLKAEVGAAITTVLSEAVVMFIGWHYAQKYVHMDSMRHTVFTSVIGCVVMCVAAYGVSLVIHQSVALLIVKVLLCALLYFITTLVMKNDIVCQYSRKVINKCKMQH